MAVFSVSGQQATVSSSFKSALGILAAVTNPRRFKIFDINASQNGAPASTDTNIQFQLLRTTGATAGTNVAFTPVAVDAADTYTTTTAATNYSAEGTVLGNVVFAIGLNQRAPYRWQTYLGSGAEIVCPAVGTNGFMFQVLSAGYTSGAGGTIFYQDQ